MAKMNVTVDNKLDEVKLVSQEKMKKKDKGKDKKSEPKKKSKKTKEKKGYFALVAEEMKLVTWPTRKNMIKYSISTLLMIVFLAFFFLGITALFDLLYTFVQEQGWMN